MKVAQSCLTLCDPQGLYSAWNSSGQNTGVGSISNPGIEPRSPTLQADSLPAEPQGKPQNTGVRSLSLLQGIFPTQGSNPGLPHCRQILGQLSHQGSPRILECVAYPFSRGPSRPRNRTQGLMHCRRILFQLSHQESPHFRESYLKRKKFSTEGTN